MYQNESLQLFACTVYDHINEGDLTRMKMTAVNDLL